MTAKNVTVLECDAQCDNRFLRPNQDEASTRLDAAAEGWRYIHGDAGGGDSDLDYCPSHAGSIVIVLGKPSPGRRR